MRGENMPKVYCDLSPLSLQRQTRDGKLCKQAIDRCKISVRAGEKREAKELNCVRCASVLCPNHHILCLHSVINGLNVFIYYTCIHAHKYRYLYLRNRLSRPNSMRTMWRKKSVEKQPNKKENSL